MNKARVLFTAILLMLIWFATQAGILVYSGTEWYDAIVDAGIFSVLLAAGAWVSGTILLYYRPEFKNLSGILAGNAILALGVILLYQYFAEKLLPDGGKLSGITSLVFLTVFLLLSLFAYASLLWSTEKEKEAEQKRKSEIETLSKEAELAGLRLQLQPHFLFNSLNSISALLGKDPEGARRMIQLLSDFLRGTIRKDPAQCITLAEELQHLRLYFEIEQIRFAGRLHVQVQTDDQTTGYTVPALILQPLMENAIRYGLYGTTGPVEILLRTWTDKQMLLVSISNPFEPGTVQSGTGFGLESVKRRLQLLYGRPDLLLIQSADKQFTCTIRIPKV